jgi:hypothetical protein
MLLSSHHRISSDWHIHVAKLYKGKVSNRSLYEVENCALLGCYVASCGNALLTFQENLSVRNYRYLQSIRPEDNRSYLLNDGSWKSYM